MTVSKSQAVLAFLLGHDREKPHRYTLSFCCSALIQKYEGRLKSSWTGGSAPLLCRGRRWLLCQVV